ncbi:hypothetical protein [Bradyrhizobium sp. JYMT SZCCT0428]|uniref:hypothetical protein n=1 Tax=Bradyrhizobium sp. JYMT SZCCT0428 TaxID=2807673 RepID=UPI001BA4D2AF|nr:hypothetical protein [Bradyrhizobium sp. JYMT SZCCT0428]MBR1153139.1 hypothetical protein [Bradyrhizobium sp. JYMT SZCCT0428]
MPQSTEQTLPELQREAGQTREGLNETVELLKNSVSDTASEIKQRIKPANIKAEVSDYVRSRGERMLVDVTEAARRNPMQAVAVGASVAYPLLRLVRSIPLPVLMVGAGLFFAGSKSGQSITQKASDMASDLSDELRRRSHDLQDRVETSLNSAREAVSDAADKAGEVLSTGAGHAHQAAGSTDKHFGDRSKGSAANIAAEATGLTGSAIASSRNIAASTVTAARNAASSASDVGLEAARGVRDKALDYSNRAGNTLSNTIQENPLLIAGVGLLLGGLLASALPKSDLEEDLVGDAAAATKDRVSQAVSKGFDAAKGAAGELLQNAARQVGADGLSPDKLDEATRDIGAVRNVAESAVTTAFDPEKTSQSHIREGNEHG